MTVANLLDLNMSRIFKCDARTLFEAVAEGALFKYTGARMTEATIDFRVGGAIALAWSDTDKMTGRFTEITPYEKIAFTWDVATEELGPLSTTVTITIREHGGKSTLTLVHQGIGSEALREDMNHGWDDALSDLRKSLRQVFAKLEENPTGLDLHFKMAKSFKAPRAAVFRAVCEPGELGSYFGVKASAALVEGTRVEWVWEGMPPFQVHVHQVIEGRLIKFQWGDAHVVMSFRDAGANLTELTIEATGWKADQAGLDESYRECDGWMEFLLLLRAHVER